MGLRVWCCEEFMRVEMKDGGGFFEGSLESLVESLLF